MESQPLTPLSQTSAEAQLRVLEMVLQIIILSTLVLFVITLMIIIWLCLRERRQPRPGRPRAQKVEGGKAEIPVFTDPHTGNSGIQPYPRAFSPWYATWARRMFLRSR
jgi:heme/copper-type cytochrome/quinol oxidase subunit 2